MLIWKVPVVQIASAGNHLDIMLERTVEVWVINGSFPSHCRSWFLEVHPHEDQEVVLGFIRVTFQQLRILDGLIAVVYGAWSE